MCLKLAALELTARSPLEKTMAFLEWVISDYMITPAAIVLSGAFFTPRRKKPMIRDLRTPDRQRVLKNIRNAAWDLVLIRHWGKLVTKQPETNSLWLLCSRDKALKKVARVIHSGDYQDNTGAEANMAFFVPEWGETDGKVLADMATSLEEKRKQPKRRIVTASAEYHKQLRSQLENEILAWSPNRVG